MRISSSEQHEHDRVKALKSYQILDSLPEEEFDRLTELAALICDTPISLVTLLDENRQWFKSKVGLDIEETAKDLSFCKYAILDKNILEVNDAIKDERFKNNPFVTGDPNIRFYAGYPLIDHHGFALGTLCVIDQVSRKLTDKQHRALELIGEQIISLIIQNRQKEELIHFEKIFNLSNDLICISGTDGYFKKINPAFETVLGWDEETIMTTSLYDMVHPDDLEQTKEETAKLTLGIPSVNFTNRLKCKDGSYKTLQWKATPEMHTGNLFAVARDITEDRIKELELAYSENQFRAFFENAHGMMCTHDLKGNVLTANTASANSLGYSVDELIRMNLFDVVNEKFHPDLNTYLEQIEKNGRMSGVMHTTHKDGSLRIWLFNNVLEKNKEGEPYVIGNALDITERHQLEMDFKKTKEMLEQTNRVARVGGWEVDLINNEVFWSTITKEIHEVPEDYVPNISTGINFYKEGESREQIAKAVELAISHGTPHDLELQIITGKGREIWVRSKGNAEMKDGKCIRIYGTFQDINEVCIQKEELTNAKLFAEQANIAKSEFLANMSHEIRTPLNGVIGFTDLVLKMNLSETQQQYITIVNQSAQALLTIINDILDFSKIEAGKLELDIDKCDLFELGNQASDIITYQVQNKSLEMLLNISPDIPRFIWTDQVRLKQVLVNLLGNAAKFTEKGEIELKITKVKELENDEVTIRFEVRDTGIGIRQEKQFKIFEAFSQEDASTTKKYGGTGLGLTISNKLLALMDSKLQLYSTPDQGSVFFFNLTLKAEHGDPMVWQNIEFIKKVLIVDDNKNNRMIMKQMLSLRNIDTDEAKNGFEALQMLTNGSKYDVVLMDHHMPYMNGLDTIKKIREIFESSKIQQPTILLHSSSDDEQVITTCKELHVEQRLLKPIKLHEMYDALSRMFKPGASEQVIEEEIKPNVITKNFKVLIAEDNPVNMLLAKTIIKRIAPQAIIIEAVNGLEAVKQCSILMPDMIFMDIQMPEMNGYEATKKIRENYSEHIPIIALTAGNVKGEKEKCIEVGMDDFIAKPFVEESLVLIIERWNKPVIRNSIPDVSEEETHFSVEKLKKYLGGNLADHKTLTEVLKLTIKDLKVLRDFIGDEKNLHDTARLNAIGHKLHGTAVSTGLDTLAKFSRRLEEYPEPGNNNLVPLVDFIVKEIDYSLELIEKHV
ncbi:response regulator [Pedobacter metabolipauper]|uniref:Sensory/regulatory protein RpfC n=1 Tax=Pedobacter metabolipauper TaxID=425513 RepID=A0A4R6SY74_9SPHI|nr:response regulator [Pedobacter metabolipauper]TDQ11356.1 PAS domain S-box-containing protein [Pedobacter metabolipauper]